MQHQRRKIRSPLLDVAMRVCELKACNREPDMFLFQYGLFFNSSKCDGSLMIMKGEASDQFQDVLILREVI